MKKEELYPLARKIIIVLIVLWMVTVFFLSNQNGESSGGLSFSVAKFLFKNDLVAEKMQTVVRKCAHMLEYAYGAILFYSFALTYPKMESKKRILFAIGCATLYAITDEIHQLLIDGRAGQITDVLIDCCGACIGAFLINFAIKLAKGTEYMVKHPEEQIVQDAFSGNIKNNGVFNTTFKVSVNDLKNKVEKGNDDDKL